MAIFADCVDLSSDIGTIIYKYCSREGNQVAHEMARDSFVNGNSCNWSNEAPSFIVRKLIKNVICVGN